MGRLLLRALGWGLVGMIVVPLVVLLLMILYATSSVCGTPGDSGGCEMGMATVLIGSVLPGFVLFFGVTLGRGLMRRGSDKA